MSTTPKAFNPYFFHSQLTKKLLELALLCNDFQQLRILSEIADLFYSNTDKQYQALYQQFENKAITLKDQAKIGTIEAGK